MWGQFKSPSRNNFTFFAEVSGQRTACNVVSNCVDTLSVHTYPCLSRLNARAFNVTCYQVEKWI